MSGEISNSYGNDFLAQQYFPQQIGQKYYSNNSEQEINDIPKPGYRLNAGLTLGTLAGTSVGTSIFFLGTNPIKNGKVSDDFIRSFDKENLKFIKEVTSNKTKLTQLPEKAIDSKYSLDYNFNQLKRLDWIKTKIEALPKDTKLKDLEKLFVENSKAFGLKGSKEEITVMAKKLASRYGSKENILNVFQERINTKKEQIKNIKSENIQKIEKNWDSTAKRFKKDTPEVLKKAYKSFKWNKALKGGGIAAAAGLAIGWLFWQ